MSPERLGKVLALLNSSTNEGEAMVAWRKARALRPVGRLFEEGGAGHSVPPGYISEAWAKRAAERIAKDAYAAGKAAGLEQGKNRRLDGRTDAEVRLSIRDAEYVALQKKAAKYQQGFLAAEQMLELERDELRKFKSSGLFWRTCHWLFSKEAASWSRGVFWLFFWALFFDMLAGFTVLIQLHDSIARAMQ